MLQDLPSQESRVPGTGYSLPPLAMQLGVLLLSCNWVINEWCMPAGFHQESEVDGPSHNTVMQAARFVSQQPDLQFPITSDSAQSWLLTTYLDEVRSPLNMMLVIVTESAEFMSR